VCLRKVEELKGWRLDGADVVLGAGITYTELMAPQLGDLLPGLAQASRTVGSPQIRNAGTLGGNLGTASPAGDSLPVLAALDAKIVVASKQGRRILELDDLIVGPKRTTLGPGEVIVEVRVPAALGSQEFLKVGTRNAMVIAVANVALVVDWAGRSVRCALGSVGPVVIRARDAEELISSRIDWAGRTLPDDGDLAEFTALVRSAARPIDDHRSTADYRRHAVGVCAYRALGRVFANRSGETLERTSWAS
jgi:CO/xanthine dehydrogenase FAD-binding subunit